MELTSFLLRVAGREGKKNGTPIVERAKQWQFEFLTENEIWVNIHGVENFYATESMALKTLEIFREIPNYKAVRLMKVERKIFMTKQSIKKK